MVSGSLLARGLGRHWSLIVLAAGLLSSGLFVAWTANNPQRHAAWRGVISTPIWPPFADLRVVAEGWEEAAAGFDPLRMDGDAPRYNYPRPWLLAGKLGGRLEDARWLGVVLAGLFLLAVFGTLRIAPGWTRLLALGIVISPATGLGLERGNGDLLIFAVMTPALLVGATGQSWRDAWPPWLVVLAAMLKLFPIVAIMGCVVRSGRTTWISAAIGILAFGGYLAATHSDVGAVLAKTERGAEASYGLALAADKLAESRGQQVAAQGAETEGIMETADGVARYRTSQWVAVGLVLAALGGVGWQRTKVALLGSGEEPPEAAVRLFVGGAAIFLVTFLFAHNWAYRLIFLIWTLPLLGHELRRGAWRRRVWAGVTLALIGSVCWLVAGASATGVWWAHAACFGLVFPLVLLGGAAVGVGAIGVADPGARRRQAIFAGTGVLLVAGTLVASSRAGSLVGGYSSPGIADAWSLLLRGKAAAADGRVPEAVASFEAAVRLHPTYADAHAQLGAALWQTGRSEEALRHLEQAISLEPRAIVARSILAGARRQQRRWDDAIAEYQESLAIRPRNILILNNLGLAYLESGRIDEALRWLEQARRIAPDSAETERNLGIVAAARGQLDEAASHFERALHLRPDYADAELQWGFALARAGRLPEAVDHFQRAVDLAPWSGQAHFILSMALRQLGRAPEGEPHFREAIRLDPTLAPR